VLPCCVPQSSPALLLTPQFATAADTSSAVAAAAAAAAAAATAAAAAYRYPGNDRSMLLPNVIFRCNGAAMLLSNKPKEARWVWAECSMGEWQQCVGLH
jgi:hypothetical protein